ncbi:MAG: acyltransferase [Proteobacteria bacterium]|nr:MAG: acyltransferase [Pseudomonadota bacterium]
MIWSHGCWQSYLDGYPVKYAPTKLGKNVWLPWHVILMPGVTIGDNVTVGAGALVLNDIPANSLAAGSPVKILKTGSDIWPPAVESRSSRIADINRSFINYFNNSITPKNMTLLAKEKTLCELGTQQNEIICGLEKIVYVGTVTKIVAVGSDTLYVGELLPTKFESSNWVSLENNTYNLSNATFFYREYVKFLSHYGIHLLSLIDRVPNHRI